MKQLNGSLKIHAIFLRNPHLEEIFTGMVRFLWFKHNTRSSHVFPLPLHDFIFFLEIYLEAPNEKTTFKTPMSAANEGLNK
jgi:hypothetical protein